MLKTQKGITLIALVVTIVVLLILAGVTISLLLDENGIIAKSKDARTETRVSQIEDEVGMWKQHNFINKESNQAQESADTMLASLISRKLLTEDEIDREQELITIKKKDGTIIKEISYSSVTINISKTPATEKSGAVVLTVDSVDGLTKIDVSQGNEELNNFVNSLSEEQKKEIIRNGYIKLVNKQDPSANCTTFQGALDWAKKRGDISEATEDAFWTVLLSEQGLDENLIGVLKSEYFNESTKMIESYTVTNPANETSNEYIATENGTYTFKIQDIVTGKTYTKKVEVTNIDENAKYYVTNIKESDINNNTAKVITKLATIQPIKIADINPYPYWCVTLKDKETKNIQTFTVAYIIYNNQKIDISSIIRNNNNCSYIGGGHICNYLRTQLNDFNADEFYKSTQQFIIEKDGTEYRGYARVDCWKGMN
ncbi:MAG: type II secretion system protein [Clostridium sp.]|nr:type II secretion system protein [Clostridium sp.]